MVADAKANISASDNGEAVANIEKNTDTIKITSLYMTEFFSSDMASLYL